MSGIAVVQLPVRFHLQLRAADSSTHALNCSSDMSFGQIKTKLWAKTGLPAADSQSYIFKLVTGEITFEDSDPFSRFLEMTEIFRESPAAPLGMKGAPPPPQGTDAHGAQILECVLLHRDHFEVKHTREKRAPTPYGVIQYKGLLTQKVEGTFGASWKNRSCILQDMSLFAFENEADSTRPGAIPLDSYELGALVAVRLEASPDPKKPFAFELRKPAPPNAQNEGNKLASPTPGGAAAQKPLIFLADSEASLNSWILNINRLHLRRTKLICVHVSEELESRGLDSSEGLFRVSGSKSEVEMLQAEYDQGKQPNLGLIADEHALSGFLKNNLRNLPDPLLSFELYQSFIKIMQDFPASNTDPAVVLKRIEAFRATFDKLPSINLGLVEFLFSFLHRVAEHSASNRMTAANLSIVFSPNILRPRVENVTTVMSESKSVQDCVECLIRDAKDIWPNFTNTRRASRLASFQPPKSTAAMPPPLPTVGEHSVPVLPSNPALPVGGRSLPPPRTNLSGTTPPPLPGSALANAQPANFGAASPPPLPTTPSSVRPPALPLSVTSAVPPPRTGSDENQFAPVPVPPIAAPVPQQLDLSSLLADALKQSSSWQSNISTGQGVVQASLAAFAKVQPFGNEELSKDLTNQLAAIAQHVAAIDKASQILSMLLDSQTNAAKSQPVPAAKPSPAVSLLAGGLAGAAAAAVAARQAKAAASEAAPPTAVPPLPSGSPSSSPPPPLPPMPAPAAAKPTPPPIQSPIAAVASKPPPLPPGAAPAPASSPVPPPVPSFPAAAAAQAAPASLVGHTVTVLFDYDGGSDSMSLKVGEQVLLLEADEDQTDWWLGRKLADNTEGYFPAAFVRTKP